MHIEIYGNEKEMGVRGCERGITMVPFISVLIPAYNYGRFIGDAVKSVLEQTFSDYEIIVVDDGSTDDTEEVVRQFRSVRYIFREHGGISKARNVAVQEAKGKWLAFLDADDLWKEDKLEKQVAYIKEHPDCRILFTRFENFTDMPSTQLNERLRELLQEKVEWCMASALIDAGLFKECGLFDESRMYGEDTEWIYRLRFMGVDLDFCLEDVLYFRRVHGENITLSHREIYRMDVCKLVADALRNARKLKRR